MISIKNYQLIKLIYMKEKIIDICFNIFMSILATLLILMIIGAVKDFKEFQKLYDATTPEEIQRICSKEWYQNKNLEHLPAKCSTVKKY